MLDVAIGRPLQTTLAVSCLFLFDLRTLNFTRLLSPVIMELMKLEVECYAGRKADERPVRFRLDGRQYLVEEVVDQWYGEDCISYKVLADDGNLYILRQ